jgi:hypothetical protein
MLTLPPPCAWTDGSSSDAADVTLRPPSSELAHGDAVEARHADPEALESLRADERALALDVARIIFAHREARERTEREALRSDAGELQRMKSALRDALGTDDPSQVAARVRGLEAQLGVLSADLHRVSEHLGNQDIVEFVVTAKNTVQGLRREVAELHDGAKHAAKELRAAHEELTAQASAIAAAHAKASADATAIADAQAEAEAARAEAAALRQALVDTFGTAAPDEIAARHEEALTVAVAELETLREQLRGQFGTDEPSAIAAQLEQVHDAAAGEATALRGELEAAFGGDDVAAISSEVRSERARLASTLEELRERLHTAFGCDDIDEIVERVLRDRARHDALVAALEATFGTDDVSTIKRRIVAANEGERREVERAQFENDTLRVLRGATDDGPTTLRVRPAKRASDKPAAAATPPVVMPKHTQPFEGSAVRAAISGDVERLVASILRPDHPREEAFEAAVRSWAREDAEARR